MYQVSTVTREMLQQPTTLRCEDNRLSAMICQGLVRCRPGGSYSRCIGRYGAKKLVVVERGVAEPRGMVAETG